jgi:hypothetical protein
MPARGGRLTCPPVGEAQGVPSVPLASLLPALGQAWRIGPPVDRV